jgi:hypothetical protein
MTPPEARDDPAGSHYLALFDGARLNEHESLTLALYFWTRLASLARLSLIDRDVACELFAWPYSYASGFFGDLARAISVQLGPQEIPPQWIEATQYLDEWLLSDFHPEAHPRGHMIRPKPL